MDDELKCLWNVYWEDRDSALAVKNLLEALLPLVKKVLARVTVHLPPHIDVADLFQSAVIGLHEAIERFDPSRNIQFQTFASRRIKGAILDELRHGDHMSRSERSKIRRIETVIQEWIEKYDRPPEEAELAKAMEMTQDALASLFGRVRPWISLDQEVKTGVDGQKVFLRDVLADPDASAPDKDAFREDVFRILRSEFKKLTSREQRIVYLYYFEELKLSEISVLFDLTEGRICQIHALIIAKLRAGMMRAGLSRAA